MKLTTIKALLCLSMLLLSISILSQNFTKHIVTTSFPQPSAVFAADVNGDGLNDILGASFDNGTNGYINWWRTDTSKPGNIIFHKNIIAIGFLGASSVYATDVDGDGDTDVLGTAFWANQVCWWENDSIINDTVVVFTQHVIDTGYNSPTSVYATDLDGDGDCDVLTASDMGNSIDWWENDSVIDGNVIFTKHVIDDNIGGPQQVYATDLEGDGDIDVFGAAGDDNEIAVWVNDGSESFSKTTIDDDFNGAQSVYATDLDGDGYTDVVGAAVFDGIIKWWKNDGSYIFYPSFTGYNISSIDGAWAVYATDVNGDGHTDVLGTAGNDQNSDVLWWKNDKTSPVPGFTKYTIDDNFEFSESIYATDIDGDGDIDIVASDANNSEIAWWKQEPGIGSVEDFQYDKIAISSYYSKQTLYIRNPEYLKGTISIYNVKGSSVLEYTLNGNLNQSIRLHPEVGIYIVSIQTNKGMVCDKIWIH